MKRFLARGLVFGIRTIPVMSLLALVADPDARAGANGIADERDDIPARRDSDSSATRVVAIAVVALLASVLTACSDAGGQQSMCPPASQDTLRPMRTGYYPDYGCGFVPPAQTHFS